MQPSARGPALSSSKGFTLIELLVVIAIVAVLSVIGIVVFTNVQKGARDAKRKADINAIAKAYEVKYNSSGSYPALTDADFASGKPKDPNSTKGDYFNWLDATGAGFKACASLEANPNDACNTPATNCYCMVSTQGTVNSSSAANPSGSTQIGIGFGGSSSPSCDPNGTLLSGLVGYWKMDDNTLDSSGNSNNGTWSGGGGYSSDVKAPVFNKSGLFDGINDYVSLGNQAALDNAKTIAAWVKPVILPNPLNIIYARNAQMIPPIGGVTQYPLMLNINGSGKAEARIFYNTPFIASSTSTLSLNQWYLLVGTWNGSNIKIYVNGNEAGNQPFSSTLGINTASSNVGQYSSGYYFNGLIDDLRLYNRALLPSEISSLYNSGSGCLP